MAQRVLQVERLVQRSAIEARSDLGVGGDELPEVPLLVPGGEGASLNEPIGVVAR